MKRFLKALSTPQRRTPHCLPQFQAYIGKQKKMLVREINRSRESDNKGHLDGFSRLTPGRVQCGRVQSNVKQACTCFLEQVIYVSSLQFPQLQSEDVTIK